MTEHLLDRAGVAAVLAAAGVAVPGRLLVVDRIGSTSTELRSRASAADPWPHGSVLVAGHQVEGRGRAGRTWTTPSGQALTFSVLLRPAGRPGRLGWVPLLGGLAVVQALTSFGLEAVLKWPNDVLLPAATPLPGWGRYRKVAGVLGDLVAGPAPAVVLGIGINVHQRGDELPVPSATSLAAVGLETRRVEVLASVLDRLFALEREWEAEDGTTPSALAEAVTGACVTIGRPVEAHRPGGQVLCGLAVGLADDGALLVEADGRTHAVHAGDVSLRAKADEPSD